MLEKEQQREIYVEKRARAVTMMLLTREENLLIEEVKEDIGLDYVVRFLSEAKDGLREFGIALRAVWGTATKEQADKELRPRMRQMKRYGPFPRPVCLFFFTMQNDDAWYTWVAEPIKSEANRPLLHPYDEADCRPLDKKALKEIIERVDSWYDALFPSLVLNGPGKSKTARKRAKQ
jgi:hypothetical protein